MDDSPEIPIENSTYPVKCDRYYTENNKTHFIYGGYEGIPENLLVNFLAWIVSIIVSYFSPTSEDYRNSYFLYDHFGWDLC